MYPFPDCVPHLPGEGSQGEGLQELDLGLTYGKSRKNGTSGKKISTEQGELLIFSLHT